jgi:hypothetical protein
MIQRLEDVLVCFTGRGRSYWGGGALGGFGLVAGTLVRRPDGAVVVLHGGSKQRGR